MHIRLIAVEGADDYKESCYQIIVSSTSFADTLQLFTVRDLTGLFPSFYHEENVELSFPDANFDGYRDLMMRDPSSDPCPNSQHKFFLFDTVAGSFRFDEIFTAKFGGNTYVREEEKTISTGVITGCLCLCAQHRTYQYAHGQFTLVKIDVSERDPNDPSIVIFTTQELIDSQMRETRREIQKLQ